MKNALKYFFLAVWILSFFSLKTSANPLHWKIAVVFFNDLRDQELNTHIQENLIEIKKIKSLLTTNVDLKIIHTSYQSPDTKNQKSILLKKNLTEFFSNSLRHNSKKILIWYGHGQALNGFGPWTLEQVQRTLVPVDILWMDSCYMSNAETAYELRHFYQYYIASEDSELSSGIPYGTLLQLNQSQTLEQSAFKLAEAFLYSYSKNKKGSQNKNVLQSATTISVIDSQAWLIFLKYFKKEWPQIKYHARANPRRFKASLTYATMDDPRWIDLGSVAKLWGAKDLEELLDVHEVRRARLDRDYDFVLLRSTQSDNPVKLLGYTLKVGAPTKTYTGLNILNPLYGDSLVPGAISGLVSSENQALLSSKTLILPF